MYTCICRRRRITCGRSRIIEWLYWERLCRSGAGASRMHAASVEYQRPFRSSWTRSEKSRDFLSSAILKVQVGEWKEGTTHCERARVILNATRSAWEMKSKKESNQWGNLSKGWHHPIKTRTSSLQLFCAIFSAICVITFQKACLMSYPVGSTWEYSVENSCCGVWSNASIHH